jgi:Cytochrome C oxidase, cbb3-type, subunit III
MRKLLVTVGVVTLLPLLTGIAPAGQATTTPADDPYEIPDAARDRRNPVVRSDDTVRLAQVLWQKHCLTCHGPQGRGDGPNARLHERRKGHAPRNLTDPKVQENLTDGEIFWRISKGIIEDDKIIMPAYEEKIPLEMQRWQLVTLVRELGRTPRK